MYIHLRYWLRQRCYKEGEKSMKCSFCGNEVEKGMKYCPLCGAEVKEETPENQTPEMENHDEPNNDYSYGQSSSEDVYKRQGIYWNL